ncbi:Elongation factor 2 protein [Pleurostoma richardsiae]|uniref:Elongation factor 2 protein n=1 Tax=Pleurostoma richardsiae TaxID=41990 RepID=A0AA38REZ3_9PEZI|nr:Elongation factor 2 protein [Pleurostoma richardsiae]
MASAIEDRIRAASTRNKELLQTLSATDHALPDLAQQSRYVADLEGQAATAARRLAEMDRKRQKELKEHASYRDSVLRRFAYKATGQAGKFSARAAKEEREYFDALREEHRESEMKRELDGMLAEARRARGNLEAEAERHRAAQRELDGLYDDIFAGPTPGFAEEDAAEGASGAALQAYHEARTAAEAEAQAGRVLRDAQARMAGALMAMEDALRASRRDLWGGGTFADMMERSALSQAEVQVAQARALVAQAQRTSPAVRDLPPVRIAQGSLMSDVFFDNIFTDMAFHEKIKQSAFEVQQCAGALAREVAAVDGRHAELARGLEGKARALEESRVTLQKAREAAFERITGRPLPPYSEGENWWE